MGTVLSVKSRWLFISGVSRESTRIFLHTESTECTELRFVSLSLHADEDILWILWILCAILFSCLTRRRKGRKGFILSTDSRITQIFLVIRGDKKTPRMGTVESVKSCWLIIMSPVNLAYLRVSFFSRKAEYAWREIHYIEAIFCLLC